MLLNSVILVLREVLEAAALISLFLALSLSAGRNIRWLFWTLPFALLATVGYASSLEDLTDALDGAGQEVVNASLQFLVFGFTLLLVGLFNMPRPQMDRYWKPMQAIMAAGVTCALMREGSEIIIYVQGFAAWEEHRNAVYAGSALGAGIGLSCGVLLLSALRAVPAPLDHRVGTGLLCLVGAGMVMQATMLLEQVDWLSAGPAFWDTSGLVSEQSIPGELLYAVIGYEATPGPIQVLLYTISLVSLIGTWFLVTLWRNHHDGA